MLVSYAWLQSYFDKPLPKAEDVARKLTMFSNEVESIERVTLPSGNEDIVIDLKVLPSRPDLLSHFGVAQELAVLFDLPLKETGSDNIKIDETIPAPKISISAGSNCPRYMSLIIRDVKVGPSPKWLSDRLSAIGQRSINNVVDAANYVMFAVGQPLHAFDLDTLSMPATGPAIKVRFANDGERMTTLDGKDVTLKSDMVVIADESKVLALAGVKGGNKDAVTEKTINIILESANFKSSSTRKSARGLGLNTDASKRYENGVSPELTALGMEMFTSLVCELSGGRAGGLADEYTEHAREYVLKTTEKRIGTLLGVSVSKEEIESILSRFRKYAGWDWKKENDTYVVSVPFGRMDMRPRENADDEYAGGVEADLIEEIGRVYGLENIPGILPPETKRPPILPSFYWSERLRNILTERGFSEVMTYAFVNDKKVDSVELENPMAEDKRYLRATIAPQLLSSLKLNIANKDFLGLSQVKIFELGHVFRKGSERVHCAFAVEDLGKKHDAKFEAESVVLDIQKMLGLPSVKFETLKETTHGVVEFDLEDLVSVLPAPEEGDLLPEQKELKTRFQAFSVYPFVVRDIAVWTNGEREVLAELLRKEAGELLARLTLFDTFTKQGTGKTSYAYRLVFSSLERTLKGEEIDAVMQRIYERVKAKGWEVR